MGLLPAEMQDWRDDFKAKVRLESSIVKLLIQWGLTEHAFDMYRLMEEQFREAVDLPTWKNDDGRRLPEKERDKIRETLRDYYLKTRNLPRRRGSRERLHNELLTGFEELSIQLIELYEGYLRRFPQPSSSQKAA
jgi:pentatricopeptide repeat protein